MCGQIKRNTAASWLMRGIGEMSGRLGCLLGQKRPPHRTAGFAVTPEVFDSIAAEIAVIDRKGIIQAVNAPWRQFSIDNAAVPGEAAPNTLTGSSYFCACDANAEGDADAQLATAGIRAVLEGSRSEYIMEYPCDSPSEKRWFTMTVKPFGKAKEPDGAVITHVDVSRLKISEEKARLAEHELAEHRARLEETVAERTAELSQALEAARVADRTKDEFLANITHELRTPLAAVIGFSKLAKPLCSDPSQRAYLDSVVSAGETLGGIIDDLLDLSKIVAGAITFETKPFSIRNVMARVGSVIGYRAIEKGLEMHETIDENVPAVLLGDPLRVEQILLNLLSNAAKFTPHGHIHTRIGVAELQQDRVCLDISVEDTGVGIAPEVIPLLFKPFSQADASVTRRFGGTGLGLAICSHLAALMDGNVTVSSRPNVGSCFEVRLWLALGGADTAPSEEENVGKAQAIRYRNAKVLVVDDQAMNRDLVEVMLKNVGIAVDHAHTGAQALDMLSGGDRHYDLVLMDIQMPVMDGLTATREIRSRQRFADLPVVAMTAHTMVHEREKTRSAGMNDHVGKPFNEDSFYRVLARWIPQSKQITTMSPPDPAADMAEFPAVRGIDLDQVRSVMRGHVDRFIYWLQDFTRQGPTAMEDIRVALANGDVGTAGMKVHAFKGRSGMLGMSRLHQMATRLEAAIDAGQCGHELVDELTRLTLAMCEDIRRVISIPEAVAAGDAPPNPSRAPIKPHETADC